MNKSPAFQFYPDKWQSHTRRLSDSAYRVYHELICWMWQSSPDHCSVVAECEAVAVAVAMPVDKVVAAFAEINNAFAPLLSCENGRWVSNGLRKEAEKQKVRREKAQGSAFARHKRANASGEHANASNEQCFPSPSLFPSPSTSTHTQADFAERPSWDEVSAHCATIGLVEWRAKVWFDEMEGSGWRDRHNRNVTQWRPLLNTIKTYWEADGRPMTPKGQNANNGKTHGRSVDRNAGTFNAGRSSEGLKSKVR